MRNLNLIGNICKYVSLKFILPIKRSNRADFKTVMPTDSLELRM